MHRMNSRSEQGSQPVSGRWSCGDERENDGADRLGFLWSEVYVWMGYYLGHGFACWSTKAHIRPIYYVVSPNPLSWPEPAKLNPLNVSVTPGLRCHGDGVTDSTTHFIPRNSATHFIKIEMLLFFLPRIVFEVVDCGWYHLMSCFKVIFFVATHC